MPDNKNKQGKQDDRRLDPKDPSEVGYAARKLHNNAQKIHEAIKEVGTSRKKVEKYVKDGQKDK